MPDIITAEIISDIYSDADDKAMDIITITGDEIHYQNVESFKIVPAEEINFNMQQQI